MIVGIRSDINGIKNNNITLFDDSSEALVLADESFVSRSFSIHTHARTHTRVLLCTSIMYKHYI